MQTLLLKLNHNNQWSELREEPSVRFEFNQNLNNSAKKASKRYEASDPYDSLIFNEGHFNDKTVPFTYQNSQEKLRPIPSARQERCSDSKENIPDTLNEETLEREERQRQQHEAAMQIKHLYRREMSILKHNKETRKLNQESEEKLTQRRIRRQYSQVPSLNTTRNIISYIGNTPEKGNEATKLRRTKAQKNL